MTGEHVVVEVDGDHVRTATVDGRPVDLSSLPDHSGAALLSLARRHPEATIAWHERGAADLLSDPAGWGRLLRNPNEVRSAGLCHALDPWLATLGAADFDSALQIPPPADHTFGSWLLSPLAGVASAPVLVAAGAPPDDLPLPAWMLVLGHRSYRAGAFLWSDPALLAATGPHRQEALHTAESIAFAVRHAFGPRFLLPWLAALDGAAARLQAARAAARAARRPDRTEPPAPLTWPEPPAVRSRSRADVPSEVVAAGVDVIIPTLGRRELLLGVLEDLAEQTVPPRSVVVVEQTGGAAPGLPIDAERWPFPFEHLIIERLGAGNARNVAISRGDGPWVLMLDDDVRFEPDLVARLVGRALASGAEAITAHLETVSARALPCPTPTGAPPTLRMWPGFGSGGALVARASLRRAGGFDRRIDGGFGEDTELGVRLRRSGTMVALASDPTILHLKAPAGGMRAPYPHPWRHDPVRPRPSPTMVFARSTFATPAMAAGYRLHWWLHGLRQDRWRFRPLRRRHQWQAAQRWAGDLAASEAASNACAVPPEDEASRPQATSSRS